MFEPVPPHYLKHKVSLSRLKLWFGWLCFYPYCSSRGEPFYSLV